MWHLNITPGWSGAARGRPDRGESRLIEMVLQRGVCMYIRVLSLTAVRAKADYGMELTLVGERTLFTGKFLSPTLSGEATSFSTVDHPLLRENSSPARNLRNFRKRKNVFFRSVAQWAECNERDLRITLSSNVYSCSRVHIGAFESLFCRFSICRALRVFILAPYLS